MNIEPQDQTHFFEWLTEQHLTFSPDALFLERLEFAKGLVRANPRAACALFVRSMIERESRNTESEAPFPAINNYKGVFNVAVQVLFLILDGEALLELDGIEAFYGPFLLNNPLWQAVSEIAMFAHHIVRGRYGEAIYHISKGKLRISSSDDLCLGVETEENANIVETKFAISRNHLDEPQLFDMQQALLGFSWPDYYDLFATNFAKLRSANAVTDINNVAILRLDRLTTEQARLINMITLTAQKVLEFEYPFYFDLGGLRGAALMELPAEAAAFNWTAYYPAYAARSASHGAVALLTKSVIAYSVAYAMASRSHMAELLERRARKSKVPAARKVQGHQGKIASNLEQYAAQTLLTAGFSVKRNVLIKCDDYDTEIDVLAARRFKRVMRLILLEAKDFDFPIHKPLSFTRGVKQLREAAERQLGRQIRWLRDNGKQALAMLDLPPADLIELTSILLVRRYVAPNLVSNCTIVPANMFSTVLSRLAHMRFEPMDGLGALLHERIAISGN